MRGSILLVSCCCIQSSVWACFPSLPVGETFAFHESKTFTADTSGNKLTATLDMEASVVQTSGLLGLKATLVVKSDSPEKPSFTDTMVTQKAYFIDTKSCAIKMWEPGLRHVTVDRVDKQTKQKDTKTYVGPEYFEYLAKMVGKSASRVTAEKFGRFSQRSNQIVLSDDVRMASKSGKLGGLPNECGEGPCFWADAFGKYFGASQQAAGANGGSGANWYQAGQPAVNGCVGGACGLGGAPQAAYAQWASWGINGQSGAAPWYQTAQNGCTGGGCDLTGAFAPASGPGYEKVCEGGVCSVQKRGSPQTCPKSLAGAEYDLRKSVVENGVEVTTKITLSVNPSDDTLTVHGQRHEAGVTDRMVWSVGPYKIDPRTCKLVLANKKVDIVRTSGKSSKVVAKRNAQEYLNELIVGMGGTIDGQFGRVSSDGKRIALSADLELGKTSFPANPAVRVLKSSSPSESSKSSKPSKPKSRESQPVEVEVSVNAQSSSGGCPKRLPMGAGYSVSAQRVDAKGKPVVINIMAEIISPTGFMLIRTLHKYTERGVLKTDRTSIERLTYNIDPKTCFLKFTNKEFNNIVVQTSNGELIKKKGRQYLNSLIKVIGGGAYVGEDILGVVEEGRIKIGEKVYLRKV